MNGKIWIRYSVLSVVFVLCCVIVSCTAIKPIVVYTNDYESSCECVIDVLAILVTVLIGWNIYTILDIKSIEKNLDNKIEKRVEDITKRENAITKLELIGSYKFESVQSDMAYSVILNNQNKYILVLSDCTIAINCFYRLIHEHSHNVDANNGYIKECIRISDIILNAFEKNGEQLWCSNSDMLNDMLTNISVIKDGEGKRMYNFIIKQIYLLNKRKGQQPNP